MNEDHKYKGVLRSWTVAPSAAPHFNDAVWRKIAGDSATSGSVFSELREWLFVQLPRPAFAAALLAATVVLSVTSANIRANHMREQYRLEQARRYLASIDPLAMNMTDGHELR